MRKTLKVKIEQWILTELRQSDAPLSYYDFVRRAQFMPRDLDDCLDNLTISGQIIRLKCTPNPDYLLNPNHDETH